MPYYPDGVPLILRKMTELQHILKPSCLQIMQKGYRLSNHFGTCPFQWNDLPQGPQTVQSPFKKILWSINALLSFTQAVFALVQCWRTSLNDKATAAHKIYIHFSAVLYMYGVLLHLCNFKNRKFLPRFVRSYIKVFEDLQGQLLLQ